MSIANMTKEAAEREGKLFSANLEKYPPEVKAAMGIVLPNLMKGCPWGIVSRGSRDFSDIFLNDIKSDYVTSYKLRSIPGKGSVDRYLVVVAMKEFITILNKEGKGIFRRESLEHALNKRNSAVKGLEKFLKAGKSGEIGIFSTNESQEIIVNGKSYPAFAITLTDLCCYCSMFGYSFLVGGQKVKPETVMANMPKVYERLHPAPNGNALFISITR